MILSQRYYGDVTIVPPVTTADYLSLMNNPDNDQLLLKIKKSEKASWESNFFFFLQKNRSIYK